MTKEQAKNIFGKRYLHLARALGKQSSTISMWPDELNDDQINMVIGAAVRKRKKIPKEIMDSIR